MLGISLAEVGAFTPVELERYHMYQDMARIEPTMLADAKAEGARETALAIAQSLLARMPNDADIVAVTGLTLAEVTALRKSKP